MAMNPAFIQLILGLQNLSVQRKEQDLNERKFKDGQEQFKEMVKQFEHTHQDKDFGDALRMFGELMPENRAAFARLARTRFAKDNPDAVEALISTGIGMPIPTGAGRAILDNALATGSAPPPGIANAMGDGQSQPQPQPQQQAQPQQQGGPDGGAAQFAQMLQTIQQGATPGMQYPAPQLGGAAGGPSTPMQSAGVPPAWNELVRNYTQMASRGYTGDQMEVQRFNASTARRGSDVDWARVREAHDQFIAEYNLKPILAKIQHGSYSPTDLVSLMRGYGDLLNDMKNPKASREDNVARMQLANQISMILKSQGLPGLGQFGNQAGANAPVGNPNGFFQTMLRNQNIMGAPMPAQYQAAPGQPMTNILPPAPR